MGTNLSLKVQTRMEDKVRIKNLKSLFEFFEKFSREGGQMETHVQLMYRVCLLYTSPSPRD